MARRKTEYQDPVLRAVLHLAEALSYRDTINFTRKLEASGDIPGGLSDDTLKAWAKLRDREEDKGFDTLRRYRGLDRSQLTGPIDPLWPYIENVRVALDAAIERVMRQALSQMPECLDGAGKVQRLFDTAPDFANGRDSVAAAERSMRAMGVKLRKWPVQRKQPSLMPDGEGTP